MSISIQTNVNSLIAQENLRLNTNFQSRTIQRLTSGFRINSSSDDAAGLAIANKFRSDTAELTQGVRNANDGISQLQIMDGGMNNIGKMLDRLKTLATQSASSTFTGDRSVLNTEYQTLVSEIDRQAQGVGLATGGHFAAKMGVYIGGGVSSAGGADTSNGTVSLDLTNSVVDAKALGLAASDFEVGTQGSVGIGEGSTASVATIAANSTNNGGTIATFNLSGPGFTKTAISVDIAGMSSPEAVATKINDAITTASNTDANLRAAGITASISTSSNGVKSLVFSSTGDAFQVSAGTKTANALLGNYKAAGTAGEGAEVKSVYTAGTSVTAASVGETVKLQFIIDGVKSNATDITVVGNENLAATQALLTAGTGFPAGVTATIVNGKATFTGPTGSSMEVLVSGDKANTFGLGSWQGGWSTTSVTSAAAATVHAGTAVMEFSINGGDKVAVQLTDTSSLAAVVTDLHNAGLSNDTLKAAGLDASTNGTQLTISTTGGTNFRYNIASVSAGNTVDFRLGAAAGDGTGAASVGSMNGVTATDTRYEATGTSQTGLGTNSDVFAFKALRNQNDAQSLVFSAKDANGVVQSMSVNLTVSNASNIDAAVDKINTQLQTDTSDTLKHIVAVKELNAAGTAEGIRFISKLDSFDVNVGKATNYTDANKVGLYDGSTGVTSRQGTTTTSSQGGVMAITDIAGALRAVSALGNAVQKLGSAQAAVGKGQNQLSYAIGLANSQISNFSSAESQIRDADVASEAANLTKGQVLSQASMAAMAQANSAPQAVLALLRG